MKAITTKDKEAVAALAAMVDKLLGYPKPGTDIASGVHAPPEQSMTLRHRDIGVQKDGSFYYPLDEESTPVIEKYLGDTRALKPQEGTLEAAVASLPDAIFATADFPVENPDAAIALAASTVEKF